MRALAQRAALGALIGGSIVGSVMFMVHLWGFPGYFVFCGMYGGGVLFALQPWAAK